jgi:hypothetical protein
MIETWFTHAHPGIYMRVTIFWAWVALLLWMPIAVALVGATEAWKFFQEQIKDMNRIQGLQWKNKHE